MKFTKILLPVLLAGLVACAADNDEDDVALEGVEDSMAMEPAPMPEAGLDQPPGGVGETAQFEELAGSGVAGEATVANRGGQSEIMVRLTGAPADSEHPGHLHTGRCDAIGGVVQPLEPIQTDSLGTGSMTAEVELAPEAVMDGQHIVVYHGTGGRPITCANLPAAEADLL